MAPQNQIAKQKQWLQSDVLKNQIQEALPKKGVEIDRFLRCLFTQVQKNPKILQCSQASIFSCVIQSAQVGIEPDGRRAHLIPYGNDLTLIIDYKGLVELAMRSGNVSKIHADIVCENDEFEYDRGELIRHKINFRKPRGEMYAAYAMVKYKDGTEQVEVLSKEEVDTVRNASKGKNATPWKDWYNEMAKKTAFRRLSKWIKLSPEAYDVIDLEDRPQKNITPSVSEAQIVGGNAADALFGAGGQTGDAQVPDPNEGAVEGEVVEPETPTKPEQEAPPSIDELTKTKAIGRIMTQLGAAKIECSVLVGWAKEQGLCKADAEDIDKINVENLRSILREWETILPQLTAE